jgi:glucose-6-phosphate isomerase
MNRLSQMSLLQKSNMRLASVPLSEMLSERKRFDEFSRSQAGMLLDFSRVQIDNEAFSQLLGLAESCGFEQARERLFSGTHVNTTEDRPAMHMALRWPELLDAVPAEDAQNVIESEHRMAAFAAGLRDGKLPGGADGKIRQLVHIGIGGSMLGTRLIYESLPGVSEGSLTVHFLSSVDAHQRERLLERLDPAETAVIIVSKSFTTTETLIHAQRLRDWLTTSLGGEAAGDRMFAVTSSDSAAIAWGVPESRLMNIPVWVGGRYSVWSSTSLSANAAATPGAFDELLRGAREMDRHFLEAPAEDNLPLIAGLMDVWHRNVCGLDTLGIVPYDSRLALLPAFLQQLIMESNGKSVDLAGKTSMNTSPVVFGEQGTDAQHSLFQALHQGNTTAPLDLLGVARPGHGDAEAHTELLANLLAQATALAVGRSAVRIEEQNASEGKPTEENLLAHRVSPGNRPSMVILLDDLSPANLGRLLAFYEHRVFVQSVMWNINAFDQWGVELGKTLAALIRPVLAGEGRVSAESGLTDLVEYINERR